jgi:hypothetical protein
MKLKYTYKTPQSAASNPDYVTFHTGHPNLFISLCSYSCHSLSRQATNRKTYALKDLAMIQYDFPLKTLQHQPF